MDTRAHVQYSRVQTAPNSAFVEYHGSLSIPIFANNIQLPTTPTVLSQRQSTKRSSTSALPDRQLCASCRMRNTDISTIIYNMQRYRLRRTSSPRQYSAHFPPHSRLWNWRLRSLSVKCSIRYKFPLARTRASRSHLRWCLDEHLRVQTWSMYGYFCFGHCGGPARSAAQTPRSCKVLPMPFHMATFSSHSATWLFRMLDKLSSIAELESVASALWVSRVCALLSGGAWQESQPWLSSDAAFAMIWLAGALCIFAAEPGYWSSRHDRSPDSRLGHTSTCKPHQYDFATVKFRMVILYVPRSGLPVHAQEGGTGLIEIEETFPFTRRTDAFARNVRHAYLSACSLWSINTTSLGWACE
ncbi:hypothetical protein TrVGV298_008966 [Trichoderma virens]|nr:hypothetical protein TrVGV298_008966 [Trichoderma virens]